MYCGQLAEEEEDVGAEWTYNSGSRRSSAFSEWGGVLVAAGNLPEDDDDDDEFALQPVSKAEEQQSLEEEDVSAEWTFHAGKRRSSAFSEWGGVLVAAGNLPEDDDDEFALQPVSEAEEKIPQPTPQPLPSNFKKLHEIAEDDATAATYQGSFSSRRDSDPSILEESVKSPEQKSKKKKSKKKSKSDEKEDSSEKKKKKKKSKKKSKSEEGESDSFDLNSPQSPKRNKSRPGLQGPTLSPMDKAKMRVSSRHLMNSARSQQKKTAKMSLNLLAFKSLNLDEEE